MNRALCVGLTGAIGSGKSTVSRRFGEHGIEIIDTDRIARQLVEPGQPALEAIRSRFGPDILTPGGGLDRAALRRRVFDDPQARHNLESLLHPPIREAALRAVARAHGPYCILVIPLLVETRGDYPLDRVLVVDCPAEICLQRVMARDGISRAEAEAILASQASREARLALADDVIRNDGSEAALAREVDRLDRAYRRLAAR